jgi:hypothetical protein
MNTLEVHRSNPPIALEAKLCDLLASPEKATMGCPAECREGW